MDTRQNHRHQKHIHHDVDLYPPRPPHNHTVPPHPRPPLRCGLETWYISADQTDWQPGQCLFTSKPEWVAAEVYAFRRPHN